MHFEAYLFRTARSVLADRHRRRVARRADAHYALDEDHDPSDEADALRTLARQDMAARYAELCAALAIPELERVAKIAHYLANTADLLGDAGLRAACVACEDAARSGDAAGAREAADLIAG